MTVILKGDGNYSFDVVGEASYQEALLSIVGYSDEDGHDHDCVAVLLLDDNNRFDANAVAVGIESHLIGYLPRSIAASYRTAIGARNWTGENIGCRAKIVGGWDRDDRGSGHFGVRLDIQWPDLEAL